MQDEPKKNSQTEDTSQSKDDDPYDGKIVYWGDPIPPGYRWRDDPGGSDASLGYLEKDDDDDYVDHSRYGW